MRKRALGTLLGVFVFSFLGCGGGGGEDPVRFWHAMGGPLGKSLSGLVEDFNRGPAANSVESVSMGRYTALSQKIMAAVAAGGPPDLAQCYEAWTANLIANESVVPFSRFLEGRKGIRLFRA